MSTDYKGLLRTQITGIICDLRLQRYYVRSIIRVPDNWESMQAEITGILCKDSLTNIHFQESIVTNSSYAGFTSLIFLILLHKADIK